MRKLPKPTGVAANVFSTCVGGVTDVALSTRLTAISATIVASSTAYDTRATGASLHLIPRNPIVGGTVSTDEMGDLYKNHMSRKAGAARPTYDALINAAPNRKCPLCGVGVVSTLDHHLPKSKYPDLAVNPLNLVPACADCNKAKLAKYPTTAGEQTIHPYYDDFTQERWLHAQIHTGSPFAISYFADAPIGWPPAARERAERHFNVFKLGQLYAANASDELATLKRPLQQIHLTAGHPGVAAHLQGEAMRYAVWVNSWQHALYLALAGDAAFCGGGFAAIAEPAP